MTELEDAQVRVARAEDAKAKLHEQIMKKHGSIAELDAACRGDRYAKKGGPKDLRRQYDRAVKELRLARSDLKRMRNEENMKPAAEEYEVTAEATEEGIVLSDVPAEVLEELKDGSTGKVVSVDPEGDTVIEITPDAPKARCIVCGKECYTLEALLEHRREEHPEPPPEPPKASGIMQHIAEKIVEAEERRRSKQLDLELKPVMLAPGLKETEKIRRSRLYEHDKFKLQITEDDLAGLWICTRSKARTTIARKLKLLPDEELFEGEWDEEVDYLLDELTKVSRQVWNERNAASGIRAGA